MEHAVAGQAQSWRTVRVEALSQKKSVNIIHLKMEIILKIGADVVLSLTLI